MTGTNGTERVSPVFDRYNTVLYLSFLKGPVFEQFFNKGAVLERHNTIQIQGFRGPRAGF